MSSLFIDNGLSRNISSVNNRDTKYTNINTPVTTTSDQLLLKIEIITTSSVVPVNVTTHSMVNICC